MMKRFAFSPMAVAIALATTTYSLPVVAQERPGAGQIYQESQRETLSPTEPSVDIRIQGQPLTERDAGGVEVDVTQIAFTGNTALSSEALVAALDDEVFATRYDLAGLQSLANQISEFYRAKGYPFARAILPPQTLENGVLQMTVIEGRYGRVSASGEPVLTDTVERFLHPLEPGEIIESAELERTLLIAGDLPGVNVLPVMRPGEAYGTGNLETQVEADNRVSGRLGADNHGSRFSGAYRARADLQTNRLLTVGDELSIAALYSSEDTWLGQLSYALPLGYSGLRGMIGYDHTDYTLGKGFEGYTGTAEVLSAGLSYPLIRRQQSNLSLAATYQHKDLDDNVEFVGYTKATESHSLPLTLQFDHRDTLFGGGITYGAATLTPGTLDIDQTAFTGNDYGFTKLNLDVARLQVLTTNLTLFGRFSGQWSDQRSLDGSESFYLGGPNGVRAFPVGEGSESRGWLAQLELRYNLGDGLSPYLLLDGGHTPNGGIDDGEDRNIAGTGLGLRLSHGNWDADLASAWKLDGGDAQSDGRQKDPRVWFNLSYRF
ncbi:ShlB/FhaC/HecB family hemolysin secretion/activation protein [Vreelandella janggokensis]|uniref:ShlB/FhaC/HecB family hemolysin secretion/activation protein n=1 Tax=Vreelandella janggokensis TaxID=370767 RepID=UPI0028619927|nr:ShlB/FhaC/HecB family hemolysin secretion/activation protein [Halomonas janggokensis]MDR5886714.1 ShlB/FhaC/HecB family hemolysin secretion/activation protein [Halomonas janggokensis]